MIVPLDFNNRFNSLKHLFLSVISIIVPNTHEQTIKSTLSLSKLIFDKLEHINSEVSFFDFVFAFSNCLADKSIPIYF